MGDEAIMSAKEHGTCTKPPMKPLRWGCSYRTADRICCFNRHLAEFAGYWMQTSFIDDVKKHQQENKKIVFYDTIYGYALFEAPVGRTWNELLEESQAHGWPSFRDQEVLSSHVRVLGDGEVVSDGGSHLGHNLPDHKGNRYCINLVSIAGTEPKEQPKQKKQQQQDKKGNNKGLDGGGAAAASSAFKEDGEESKEIQNLQNLLLNEFATKYVKDRRYMFRVYKKCFVGKDLVDWLMSRKELMVERKNETAMLTRSDALAIGQDFLNMGFFSHVLGEHNLEDKHLFYRFQRDGGAFRKPGRRKTGPMLLISNIFKWYKSDFPAKEGGTFGFIRQHHPELKGEQFRKLTDNDVTIRYQMYDWRLNSVENGKKLKPLLFGTVTSS
uniref:DEP domain-containing protein n=1 Tax=Lotharella globosa TaxID=91324 RepID=A0A7S4DMV9_9EUKA